MSFEMNKLITASVRLTSTILFAANAATEYFTAIIAMGQFDDKAESSDIDEIDLILGYRVSDKFDIEFVYTGVGNKAAPTDADTNFTRNIARVNYSF